MKIFVTDFSSPIGASVFKFCGHLHVGKVYCINENEDANPHFAFFFKFANFPSFAPIKKHMDIFSVKYFSATTLKDFKNAKNENYYFLNSERF